jgi:beta-xylosidase
MVYHEEKCCPILNWQYVDLVYDHWLSIGIRPFVELGFMPCDLASGGQSQQPGTWHTYAQCQRLLHIHLSTWLYGTRQLHLQSQ